MGSSYLLCGTRKENVASFCYATTTHFPLLPPPRTHTWSVVAVCVCFFPQNFSKSNWRKDAFSKLGVLNTRCARDRRSIVFFPRLLLPVIVHECVCVHAIISVFFFPSFALSNVVHAKITKKKNPIMRPTRCYIIFITVVFFV